MWLRLCTHYIDDLLPYESLATGDVVKFFILLKLDHKVKDFFDGGYGMTHFVLYCLLVTD